MRRSRRRALGQHYLVDEKVADRMVSLAEVGRDETVLEIGTGRGVLTKRLLPICRRVEAYEVDSDNVDLTLGAVSDSGGRLEMHNEDAFKAAPEFDVLVSSLPYSKSAEFIEWLCRMRYKRAVVLLQEDFVRKISSPPGSRNYRAVSVVAQISSELTLADRVGREAFSPMPRVDSRIVKFSSRRRLSGREVTAVKKLFSLRRRSVSAVLKGEAKGKLRRVNELMPDEVYAIVHGGRDLSGESEERDVAP